MNSKNPSRRLQINAWWAAARLAVALTLGLLSASPGTADDGAAPGIDALAYDTATGALLKADQSGLYLSQDGGRSWQAITDPPPAISAIAVGAGDSGPIYVVGSGLWVRARDSNSWTRVDGGLPSTEITALAAHSTQPKTVYAYLPDSGIFQSKDAGANWKLMDRGPAAIANLIHTNLAGSMESGWLYAATAEGVRFSMDCFCLWREAIGLTEPVRATAVDPSTPEVLFATAGEGVFVSTNGGRDWEAATGLPDAVTALIVTPSGDLYAGTTGGRLFLSVDRAATWEQVDG